MLCLQSKRRAPALRVRAERTSCVSSQRYRSDVNSHGRFSVLRVRVVAFMKLTAR